MLTTAAWALSVLFGSMFVLIAAFNANCLLRMAGKTPGPSVVPFVGGAMGSVALAISPASWLRSYWWVPFLVDCSYALFLLALPMMLREAWQFGTRNLLLEYHSHDGKGTTMHLRLFRSNVCLLLVVIDRNPDDAGVTRMSMPGKWQRSEQHLSVDLHHTKLLFQELPDGGVELRHSSGDSELLKLLPSDAPLQFRLNVV